MMSHIWHQQKQLTKSCNLCWKGTGIGQTQTFNVILTLEVPEILHYPEVPSGVKLTLPFIDAFYIFKFQLNQLSIQWA